MSQILNEQVVALQDYEPSHQQPDIQFIKFKKDQIITVSQKFENGWWYGGYNQDDQNFIGFFPSNFVKEIQNVQQENNDQKQIQNNIQQEHNEQKEIQTQKKPQKTKILIKQSKEKLQNNIKLDEQDNQQWLSYITDQFNQGEIKVQSREYDQINKEKDEQKLQQSFTRKIDSDFVIGYKKMKLDEKAMKNPKIIEQGEHGLIAIKEQTQVAKAYRQMYNYFDYEQWIDQRNKEGNKKSKPDIRRKKIKKQVFELKYK